MPDINQEVAPASRQPRGAVKLNGTIVAGWTAWEVENNVYRAADTFTAHFAISDLPSDRDLAWFSTQTSIIVELFATVAPGDPANYAPVQADRIFYGQADHISIDLNELAIELTGRDLTAKLIDTKTSEDHQNQTSSQVATLLAQREGLKPVVTATRTRIGNYYQQDHVDVVQEQSEWDLLSKLADYEGFDLFVTGDELHFQPKPTDGGDVYALVWKPAAGDYGSPSSNTIAMSLSRDLTIAKGVTVTVRSWNAKQKKAFTVTWPKAVKSTKPGQATDNNTAYHRTIPGLTQDQAQLRAQQIYNQVIQHAVKLDATLPADGILDCSKKIRLRGTATAFDQIYYPDSVKRSMSVSEGFRMSVSAKNLTQDLEADAA